MRPATTRTVLSAFALAATTMPALAQAPTADNLASRQVQRRAVEAVIWGMPAVNFDLMFQAAPKAGAKENQIVYWSNVLDWKNQTLTPNPSTIYLMPFLAMKDVGPMVVEIPPAEGGSITGTIFDAWQVALEDVGPAGADKGKGGKYLILPSGYGGTVPEGYIVLRSGTNMAGALLRSNVSSGSAADIAKAVAYGKRIKLYPLSSAANPPATAFVDAISVVFDSTIPYDTRFFESLDRFVQREPWLERDRAMIDPLKSVGIEQGKSFTPGTETRKLLDQAAGEAHGLLDQGYEALFSPYYPGGQWALPLAHDLTEGLSDNFAKPGVYPIDTRGVFFSMAFSSVKHLGTGQFYLVSLRDTTGQPFDGGQTYRLTVPPDVPAQLYWSATVYDRETHALIRDQKWPSRGSTTPGLQLNGDGSVELFFGPNAPAGKETNWVPTQAGRGWEVMMRFYGPQKPLFDKTWRLPDVERVAALSNKAENGIPVTVDNFVRAETDTYFDSMVKQVGMAQFLHHREPMAIDHQTVIRANRDTLYSAAVFDLDAGPVTITLPEAGSRLMSLQTISEDHYTTTVYGAGEHTFDKAGIGTRYLMIGIRTLVDPSDPGDVRQVHALQDAIKVTQTGGPGHFEAPAWDPVSHKKVRDALLVLASTVTDTSRAFGTKDQVDPVQRLVGAASAWGANPPRDAIYLNFVPEKNDGTTVYRLAVKDVPVDGFWSVSVYNEKGYYEPNPQNAYSLNNITAKRGPDGATTIQFGGCGGEVANCLPVTPGWNYMVRLYRPRIEALNGTWKVPEAQPVN